MKSLFLYLLFAAGTQSVVFNMNNDQIIVANVKSDPIEILIVKENAIFPVSCLHDESAKLKDVNFTNSPACLMNTLNQQLDMNITEYADLKDLYTQDELSVMKEQKKVSDMIALYFRISHSYGLSEVYDLYANAEKNEFRYEIHTLVYLKINDAYLPLSYKL